MSEARERRMVRVDEVQQVIFVRDHLDTDRANELAMLICDDRIPAILINTKMELIDGRHRIAACQQLGLEEFPAEVVDVTDRAEMISLAYKANQGGALPPTAEDRDRTISELIKLEHRISIKRLAALLDVPYEVAKAAKGQILFRLAGQQMAKAKQAVINGSTVDEASAEFDVDIDKLKEVLEGKRRSGKASNVKTIKAQFTSHQRTSSGHRAQTILKLCKDYEDGDISAADLKTIADHSLDLAKKAMASTTEQHARVMALIGK